MFADTLKTLPFNGRSKNGTGFFPPMFRASQHILFLVACVDDKDVKVTEKDAIEELTQAQEHWNARAKPTSVSIAAAAQADGIGKLIGEAIGEYPNWSDAARVTNLRDLAHRVAQHAADLDRELVGLRDSDPGTSL